MHGFARAGMGKAELPGVEHLALVVAGHAGGVEGIPQQGMAKVFQVDPDLMGAARVEDAFDQGADSRQFRDDPPGGSRGTATPVQNGHFFSVHRVAADVVLDCAASRTGEVALYQGEVDFRHGASGDLPGEMGVGGVVLCDHEAAAGILVQPMDDARALLAADPRKGGAMGE